MNKHLNTLLIAIGFLLVFKILFSTSTLELDKNNECTWEQTNEYLSVPSDEVMLLAKLINSESHGESVVDKLLVGSVVINRMRSDKFPNTLEGVIYQDNQFSGIGSYYFKYDTSSSNKIEHKANIESIRCAQQILKYGPVNPRVLYFLNPTISTDFNWKNKVMKRKLEFRSENHYFYR